MKMNILNKIPGFRSNKLWKKIIASISYSFIILFIIATLVPSTPSLALETINPTNRGSVSIGGKTYSGKPVYLLQNNQIIQEIKADSSGQFIFALNDLEDGKFTYTIEVCNSDKKNLCKTENILITVDQTPPVKPIIALPNKLPETNEESITIKGSAEPATTIIASINDVEQKTVTNTNGEFFIDTKLGIGGNNISIKSVDNLGNESETITSSLDFNPTRYKAKVVNVVDGDTIKIDSGETVRYIGIDTPETVHPSKPVQCMGKEASEKNTELVEGKEVTLEKDVSETDKYGRLLRYIWIGDILVNEYLVQEGYAQSSAYPPDIKYQDKFDQAEQLAKEQNKGLWGGKCNVVITPTPIPVIKTNTIQNQNTNNNTNTNPVVVPQITTAPIQQNSGSFVCDCSKTCPNMSSCAEAQYQLNTCGCTARDGDHDGIACDSDCQ